jgi:hypothetical protein
MIALWWDTFIMLACVAAAYIGVDWGVELYKWWRSR